VSGAPWRTERARLAGAVSNGNTALAQSARVRLKELRAEDYIKKLVDEAPPLSESQRDRLALLLRGGAAA
jgi:hypothetical protein